MEVKINKEIRDYQESVFFGLSLRQFVFSLTAVGVAVTLYFSLIDALGSETVSWVCILGAFPFALLGFLKYQGMTAERFLMAYIESEMMMPRQLISKPYNLYADLLKETYLSEVYDG